MDHTLGKRLKQIRTSKGESITQTAKALGVNRSYLSRIESGQVRPSIKILNSFISHFMITGEVATQLLNLTNHEVPTPVTTEVKNSPQGATAHSDKGPFEEHTRRKEEAQMEEQAKEQQNGVQVNMPAGVPILYSDSCFVSANNFGIVFDFAQTVGPTNQQNVVSRIGMSRDHAEAVVKVLSQKLADTRIDVLKTKKEN